ncbi:MAG: hypothetical protein IJ741_06930 [Schwartzia sp.]|nr:hypothetical protein [Schwartzia sp. (in: firmicutes)]
MKKMEITPDLIIALGMSIALILAVIFGSATEITIGISAGLGGYLGQVVSNDETKKKENKGGGQDASN